MMLCAIDNASPKVSCISCGHSFCALHGDAHIHSTCDTYAEQMATDPSISEISQIAKPCPNCGMGIELEAGCSHGSSRGTELGAVKLI